MKSECIFLLERMTLSCLRQGITYYLSFFSKLQGVFNKRLLDMATVGHDALHSNYTIARTAKSLRFSQLKYSSISYVNNHRNSETFEKLFILLP